jgi:indole-3-glycerol phosphate synthase
MTDFLQQMGVLSEARALTINDSVRSPDAPLPLRLNGFDVIAEIKDRSPSAGDLATTGRSRLQQLKEYEAGGAAAVSVLTEPSRFAGDIEHLAELAAVASVPLLRKDFLIAPQQITEARNYGASGVLLIAAMLSDARLLEMLDQVFEQSMFVLLEAFDEDDLRRSAEVLSSGRYDQAIREQQFLVGVNTRNLRTLAVDAGRLADFSALLPPSVPCVAESGLVKPDDAAAAKKNGYQLALVGGALMKSEQPQQLLHEMIAAGRAI